MSIWSTFWETSAYEVDYQPSAEPALEVHLSSATSWHNHVRLMLDTPPGGAGRGAIDEVMLSPQQAQALAEALIRFANSHQV